MNEVNEIGQRAYFWYRIYLGVLAVLYLAVTVLGVVLALLKPETADHDRETLFMVSILYAVIGAVLFMISLIALSLPVKPYNWLIGLVMIVLGMTSCLFLPFLIPLFVYWMKPETKAFFGRT